MQWADGDAVGGFSSRGLGRFHLENFTLYQVDLHDPEHRLRYLTARNPEDRMERIADWQRWFADKIQEHLSS